MKIISLFKDYSIYSQYVSVLLCAGKNEDKDKTKRLKPSAYMSPAWEETLDISKALFCSNSVKLFHDFKNRLSDCNLCKIKGFFYSISVLKLCNFCQLSCQLKNGVQNSPFLFVSAGKGVGTLIKKEVGILPPTPPVIKI